MKTAFLFPGQGAQTVGMGKDLYDNFNIYKQTFEQCEQGAELDLKAACFEGERMDESEVVQPSIFAHSISLLAILRSEGIDAEMCAGLSLGEYSALTAGDVFDVTQCAALVRKRGHIMDGALPIGAGGMLSVIGFDIAKVQDTIKDYDNVYVANHLSELQIVLAGHMENLRKLEAVFKDVGAKMVAMLNVRGPFHAPLLSNAADEFLDVLQGESLGSMKNTVYSNVLGNPYEKDSDIKALLTKQMCDRVRWHDCVEDMVANGVERYVEVGPGNVLGKLVKRRVGRGNASVTSVKDAATLEKFLKNNGV